jgi:hypothetical protein
MVAGDVWVIGTKGKGALTWENETAVAGNDTASETGEKNPQHPTSKEGTEECPAG